MLRFSFTLRILHFLPMVFNTKSNANFSLFSIWFTLLLLMKSFHPSHLLLPDLNVFFFFAG